MNTLQGPLALASASCIHFEVLSTTPLILGWSDDCRLSLPYPYSEEPATATLRVVRAKRPEQAAEPIPVRQKLLLWGEFGAGMLSSPSVLSFTPGWARDSHPCMHQRAGPSPTVVPVSPKNIFTSHYAKRRLEQTMGDRHWREGAGVRWGDSSSTIKLTSLPTGTPNAIPGH